MFVDGTFYRIESVHGLGPYACLGYKQIFPDKRYNLKLRPSPFYDEKLCHYWRSIGNDSQLFLFGFKNKKQLNQWFPARAIKAMAKASKDRGLPFFVSIYKARIVEGEKQAIARKKDLELVERIAIEDFV